MLLADNGSVAVSLDVFVEMNTALIVELFHRIASLEAEVEGLRSEVRSENAYEIILRRKEPFPR